MVKTMYTNSENKKVSACFLDNKAFKALIEGKTAEELVNIYNGIEKSAIEVENSCNEGIARCRRAITTLEQMEGTEDIIARNEAKIEKYQNTIDSLNPDENDFVWYIAMMNIIAEAIGDA